MIGRTTLVLALAAVMTACGDDATEPEVTSSFEMQVTGSLTESAEGLAYFGVGDDEEGDPVWSIVLEDDAGRHTIVTAVPGTSRPAVGTYDLAGSENDSDWLLLHIVGDGDELLDVFVVDSGSITIAESTSRAVRGTLEFNATGSFGTGPSEIEVTAAFVAVPGLSEAESLAERW